MREINIFKYPVRFIRHQISREFFGFIGFLSSTTILGYGVLSQRKATVSLASIIDTDKVFTISITLIGIILMIIFLSYFGIKYIIKRK